MMTPKEMKEFRVLLNKLDDEELKALKDTVTKRQIAVEDRNEATNAIIEYSSNAAELLRRRKIRRDLLFQYLVSKSIVVAPNAEKHVLVSSILTYWGSQLPVDGNLMDIASDTCLANPASRRSGSETAADSSQTTPVQAASAGDELHSSQQQGLGQQGQETPVTGGSHPNPESQVMGERFVTWFYKLLNAENPLVSGVAEANFGPQHFWDNCSLRIVSMTQNSSDETFAGSMLVSQRLKALVREEHLLFNPNVSKEGVRTTTSPYGLFMVMVCGTIHQHNNCLGVFEQMFGIVRDPSTDNSWKIKVTNLRVISSQTNTIPRIRETADQDMLAVAGASMPSPVVMPE